MTDFRSRWFALLEFQLTADTPSKMFGDGNEDREHYIVYGHDRADCAAIKEKRTARAISLSDYLSDHEFFDGELTFSDPWPCAKCIPESELPKVELPREDFPRDEHRWMEPRTAVPTKEQLGIPDAHVVTDEPPATDAQVRKMMVLYRKSKPGATKDMVNAAQKRAKAMTKRQASAAIDKMEKAEKPETATVTLAPDLPFKRGDKVQKNAHPGTIFWVGADKRTGSMRYGVEYIDQHGQKQREFTNTGWTLTN